MIETKAGTRKVTGRIKWFDPVKGFGFVLDEEGGADILLHANVLRNFGQGSVADNSQITVIAQATPKGTQAIEVLDIIPPEGENVPLSEGIGTTDSAVIAALPLEPARVKWFDKGKGFGFANVFGRPEDVFLHVEVLRRSGFADLAAGEAICVKILEGQRGRMAAQILAWDTAMHVETEQAGITRISAE